MVQLTKSITYVSLWKWVLKRGKTKKIIINVMYELATRAETNSGYNFIIFQENFQITFKKDFSFLVQNGKCSNFPHPVNTNQLFSGWGVCTKLLAAEEKNHLVLLSCHTYLTSSHPLLPLTCLEKRKVIRNNKRNWKFTVLRIQLAKKSSLDQNQHQCHKSTVKVSSTYSSQQQDDRWIMIISYC